MATQTLNYEKYVSMSERQLKSLLATTSKKIAEFKANIRANEIKMQNTIKKEHLIKDALMEKWRQPSDELKEAIREVENGETTTYDNIDK